MRWLGFSAAIVMFWFSGAAAQDIDCTNPTKSCSRLIAPECLSRVGAGTLVAGSDCASQFEAYRGCLAVIAEQCSGSGGEAASSSGCSAEDARQLYTSIDQNDPDALRTFFGICPGTPQAKIAAFRLSQLEDQSAEATAPQPGETFRDCAECPEMVVIPGGSFTMGSPDGEPDRETDEGPTRRVSVNPFGLGRDAVTVAEFRRFARSTGRKMSGCATFTSEKTSERKLSVKGGWERPGFRQEEDHPAVCVSHDDAEAYLTWLNDQVDGAPYRLPSEAEQEYVLRAENGADPYPWGQSSSEVCAAASSGDRTLKRDRRDWRFVTSDCSDGYAYTAPVDAFPPNAWGVRQLSGNVWEWAADCWNDSYVGAPSDESPWLTGDCSKSVLRTGSWFDNPWWLRSANRNNLPSNARYNNIGFRIARTLTP